jgi:hypothetical protein
MKLIRMLSPNSASLFIDSLLARGGPAEEWSKCGAVLVRPDAKPRALA